QRQRPQGFLRRRRILYDRKWRGGAPPLAGHSGGRAMTVATQCRTIICALLITASAGSPTSSEPQGSAVLPGGNSKDPVNIDAAKLDYFDKERKLIYTGNVVLTQGEGKLQAGKLIIFLAPNDGRKPGGAPSSSSQVRRMEVPGPVTVLSKDQIGTGDS